jgi:hypothetical protein
MRKLYFVGIAGLALLALVGAASAAPPGSRNFVATLSGADEVPARDTPARGNTIFHLSRNGAELSFKLIVANIENVVAAHIHCAPPGVNGPVGVTLFSGGAPGSGVVNGILAQGTITGPDSTNGCGWETLADVVEAMRAGRTYVNVHTSDGQAPPDSGPGDFPGGEIRGQVREAGPS